MRTQKPSEFVVVYRSPAGTTVMVLDGDKVDPWAAMNVMQARLHPEVTEADRQADRRRADEILRKSRAQ